MAIPSTHTFPSSGIWPGVGDTSIYQFTPPGFRRVASGSDRLWSHWKSDLALSVMKNGSAYTEVEIPDAEDVEAADAFYLGGHTYFITADEADALTAAGFGAGVSTP